MSRVRSSVACSSWGRGLWHGLAVLLVWAITRASAADAWPAVPGAVFAVPSADITKPVVAFDGKGRPLLAFEAAPRARGLIGRCHEFVCDGGSFHAREAGGWVGRRVAEADAFSIEATLVPAVAPPVVTARLEAAAATGTVLAFADDTAEDVALVQGAAGLGMRVAGGPAIDLFAVEAGRPVHVVVCGGDGRWTAYRDGGAVASGRLPANATRWGERQLVLGASWKGDGPWRGRLEGVAIFPRVLTAAEVAAEARAAAALRADRKPARQVRFRGTLVRQAETADVAEIRPYTRSLSAAAYRVDEVVAGDWAEPTITVFHWMVMDGRRLPLADRQAGAEVDLIVEPLAEHPQLESSRRDELTDGDLAADVFYCESEPPR